MLEAIAIAALIMGSASTAAVITDDRVSAETDQPKAVVIEQQEQPEGPALAGTENPFLD